MRYALQRGRYRTVNGIRLHYVEFEGDGPPLVLIPGITSPAVTWQFVGERLADFARVFILDNRGRGLSSAGADLAYTLDDYAADTAGLIDSLGLGRPTVLGHSMGGRIALKLAADHADKVGQMVLVDPPVTGPGRRPYPVPLQWYLDGIDAACRGEETDASSPLLANWTAEQIAVREEWLPTCDKTAVAETHRHFHDEDVHALMPRAGCPTLLIYAEKGNTVTDADADEITATMPDCRALKIDGVGHMIPWDDLDGFADAVRTFVAADR